MSENELKKHTTFKVGGCAKSVCFPAAKDEFVEILKSCKTHPVVLGHGSNVLISSAGVEEDVIITSKMSQYSVLEEIIEAQCGVSGPLLAKEAQKHSLTGFEFLAGFPGSVGGIVYMNAGAHGQCAADCFVSCEVFNFKSGKVLTLSKDDLKFSYRKSILSQNDYVLLSAKFKLQKSSKEKIDDITGRNIEFRKRHQPSLSLPNAGSVFKNPEGDSAGRLLDLAGAKELTCTDAKVYDKHANFIINTGNATSLDISQLMLKMYNIVEEKYSIKLRPEIKYVGIMTEEERKIWNKLLSQK